ncbi:40S ribosomal protein S4-3 [Zea mays]|uniref:40S ribosomal protein S4-3 n=1 Tax=Zea mays TaxID=4577 RepID=A0A1D6NZM2_MAIZE|nr:40S ribosomal protein S4-3 [Zea mays]
MVSLDAATTTSPCLRDAEGLYLASDSNKRLLIYFPFMQVKLHSVLFKGPKDDGLPVLMDLCLFGTLPLLMGNRQGENLLIDLFRHCDNHLGEKQVNNPFFHKTPSGSARQPLQLTNDVTKMMQKHQLETPQFHQTRFSVLQNVPRSTEKCVT